MDILIIGGTRFVGYQLAWRLVAGGHLVTLLNRGTTPDPFGDRVDRLIADRTSPDFARVLASRSFDAAVDFACYDGDDARGAVDVLGGGRVGHYVMISTGQVYLVRDGAPSPSREADYEGPTIPPPADPADLDDWRYGIKKRDAEDAIERAEAGGEIRATRLRLPMVHGERDHYRRLESYLWRLLDGGPILLPDGGDRPTRHVYSGAVVGLVASILGEPAAIGRAFNVAQAETPTLRELVGMMAGHLGAADRSVAVDRARIEAAGLAPGVISPLSGRWMSFLDPTRAVEDLGFRHEPVDAYLGKVVSGFINNPPSPPPANYAHRQAELDLARSIGG